MSVRQLTYLMANNYCKAGNRRQDNLTASIALQLKKVSEDISAVILTTA